MAEGQSKFQPTADLAALLAKLTEIKTELHDLEIKIDQVKTDGSIRVETV